MTNSTQKSYQSHQIPASNRFHFSYSEEAIRVCFVTVGLDLFSSDGWIGVRTGGIAYSEVFSKFN